MTKNKNVPELRFPKFEGKWIEKRIAELFLEFKSGFGITSKEIHETGEYAVYGGNGLRGYSEKFTHEGSYFLIGRQGALCGNINKVNGKNYISEHAIACKANESSDTEWLAQRLDFFNLNRLSESSAQPGLSVNKLLRVKIIVPLLREQQKIANFLTALDTKIQQLTQKKALLEAYKKGVMQQIFKQEIRFRDEKGKAFEKWKEKRLGDFLIPTLREVDKPKSNYLAIGIRSHCKGTFQKPNFDPAKIAMEKLFEVKEDDLIVNITFAWEGAIAKVKKEDEGGLVSHRFPTYTFKRSAVMHEFFQFVFIQKLFRFQLILISPGGAGRNRVMSKKEFLKIKWKLPSVPEQLKIANCLISFDAKIEEAGSQLNYLKKFKKGLLQKMFV